MTRAALVALLLCAAACKREPPPAALTPLDAPTSRLMASESRPIAETLPVVQRTAWADVIVEANQGWAADFVARTAIAEIDAVRAVMLKRGPCGPREPPEPVQVRYVLETKTAEGLLNEIPRSDRVLRWGNRAFWHPASRRLVITRDAEISARMYMTSLALLMAQPDAGATWHLDAAAIWLSGLALGYLKNEPFWERGRAFYEWLDVAAGLQDDSFQEALGWALSDLPPEGLDLDFETGERGRGLRSPLHVAFRTKAWPHREPIEIRHRAAVWSALYFLGTFAIEGDGRVRWSGPPKYEAAFRGFVVQPASAFLLLNEERSEAHAEIGPYLALVRRKLNLGHVRTGVVLAWDEFTNRKGLKTGEPGDDVLH